MTTPSTTTQCVAQHVGMRSRTSLHPSTSWIEELVVVVDHTLQVLDALLIVSMVCKHSSIDAKSTEIALRHATQHIGWSSKGSSSPCPSRSLPPTGSLPSSWSSVSFLRDILDHCRFSRRLPTRLGYNRWRTRYHRSPLARGLLLITFPFHTEETFCRSEHGMEGQRASPSPPVAAGLPDCSCHPHRKTRGHEGRGWANGWSSNGRASPSQVGLVGLVDSLEVESYKARVGFEFPFTVTIKVKLL
jgi:hypothetical protein